MDSEQPMPLTCPSCLREYEFEPDGDGDWWPGAAEWWHNGEHEFLCSRVCWMKAEGYAYDRELGRWVRPGSGDADGLVPPS